MTVATAKVASYSARPRNRHGHDALVFHGDSGGTVAFRGGPVDAGTGGRGVEKSEADRGADAEPGGKFPSAQPAGGGGRLFFGAPLLDAERHAQVFAGRDGIRYRFRHAGGTAADGAR